jgi:hypothetical protein
MNQTKPLSVLLYRTKYALCLRKAYEIISFYTQRRTSFRKEDRTGGMKYLNTFLTMNDNEV